MTDLCDQENIVPPSTGKKKKARRVFGNILSNGELSHSLSYTPSPTTQKKCDNPDETHDSSTSKPGVALATNLFSIAEATLASSHQSTVATGRKSEASFSLKSASCRSQSSSVVVCKPFSNVINDEDKPTNKKNLENVRIPESIRVPADKASVDSNLSVSQLSLPPSEPTKNTTKPISSTRSLQQSSTTNFTASHPTTKVPRNAGRSVNRALNAAKLAREKAIRDKVKAAAMIRGRRKEEKEEAIDFNLETEKMRREQLNLQHQLSSQFSKAKAKRNQQQRHAEREATEKESVFKSTVAREHQKKMKELEDERRRQSIVARTRIRENNRQGEEKLKLMRIEEEQALFEERESASQALEQYKKDRCDSARKNFQFRRGDAIRIRKMHDNLEAQRLREQHESFELMFAAARDADEYHREMERKRRESLANRNIQAREQRKKAEYATAIEKQEDHESYELKWAGESDANEYKKQLADQRRQSLEQRNAFARNIRQKESQKEAEEKQRKHESWELKFAADKDTDEYRNKMEAMRRQSLQLRNKEAKNQRDEDEQRCKEAKKQEHESYELKWNAERDANAYLCSVREQRRKSLESRNLEARKQRQQQEAKNAARLHAEHESFELKRAADKDTEAHRKKLEQDRRESLASRNKEKARHAQVMEELSRIAKEEEAESYMLKWAGENDAKQYMAELEAERRKSIHLRNEEGRRHREIDDEMRRQELLRIHEDEELKAAGHQDIEQYRKECAERDRSSLEYRGKETLIQRLEETNRKEREREQQEKNFELETLARQDVENYLKKCKNQRRKSLAFRAKEKRRHAEWLRQEEERELLDRDNDSRMKARDARSMELARQRERTEKALEALRHANCTFSSFPSL